MNSKNKTKKLLLLGILLFGFTASGWSQKVSLNFKDEKIEKVLSSIKSQTGMALVFSDQVVDVNRLVSIQVKDCNLEEALGKLLTGTKVAYEINLFYREGIRDNYSFKKKKGNRDRNRCYW